MAGNDLCVRGRLEGRKTPPPTMCWFTYSNGYWEVYRCFQGDFFGLEERVRGVSWEDISMKKLLMGEDNFNEGGAGFSSII